MRIWPVILDSQPEYLRGRGRSRSLLLAPVGRSTLVEHLLRSLSSPAENAPVVASPANAGSEYRGWIQAVSPAAKVVDDPQQFIHAFAGIELSDAFLVIDPRCLATNDSQLSRLMRQYATEPQVAHCLVAFEAIAGGTTERVSVDADGRVRGIHRHYEQATWPFISGIMAAIVPVACGVLRGGVLPSSLTELRKTLAGCGVPGRDVAIEGTALNLSDERGLLAANELFTLRAATARRKAGVSDGPILVGSGHSIHPKARLVGPIVVHADAQIEERATILGPAVIGAGARIGSGAVVAHATIGADCVVPAGHGVRDQVWFEAADPDAVRRDRPASSFDERLAHLSAGAPEGRQEPHREEPARRRHLYAKRAVDMAVAAAGLTILSPVLLLIAVVVWIESKGPILFGHKREGLGGRPFRCLKFRTMYTGAELAQHNLTTLDHTDGPHFKVERDPRVTRAGRLLRALNLDELPQLVNVLLGEMSLIGPRPSPFRENQICVPWREARLSVRPGITGLWQVCRHDRSDGDFHQWIEYDLLYVQHLSFWLDLRILAATLVTLGGKAALPVSWLVRPVPVVTEDGSAARRAPQQAKEAVAA